MNALDLSSLTPARAAIGFFLLCVSARAQATWVHQAPLPTTGDLHAVAVVSASEVWVCGDPGLVARTPDAGSTWEIHQLPTSSLYALDFLDAQHGWAAGNGFFHTVDGGQHWIQDNTWGSIYDLQFIDAQNGFACGNGGTTYRTIDGGHTWNWATVGGFTTLSSIFFVDAQHGWTVAIDGLIHASTDGGQTWTMQHDAAGYLSTIQFFDTLDGWAIGGDTFVHTLDGGQTWIQSAVPAGTWSHSARFADRQHGISVGQSGNVTITSDFGQTWTTTGAMGAGPLLWDVESFDASISYAVGGTGALSRTSDGGTTWTSIHSGGTGSTHGLDAVDAAHAWAANDGGEVLYTVNGGAHWEPVVVDGFDEHGIVRDVDFLDAQLGWAVGRNEPFPVAAGQIARSTDGGRHWILQHSVPNGYVEDVEVIDAQTVLALGSGSSGVPFILRTTDAGQSWTDVAPAQSTFLDADFVDASTGWVVGAQIHKTIDGGQNWVQQATPPNLLQSVSFADAQNGWAVGWSSTVLHTTDGGLTWMPQNPQSSANVLFEVQAFSATEAIVCGSAGFVARTHDGGLTWISESVLGVTDSFETLFFPAPDRGWIGGAGIWHFGTGIDSGTAFCAGDGSGTACPCGNFSPAGSNAGCTSSVGSGGTVAADGQPSLASDSLVLHGAHMPNSAVLYFQGTSRQGGGAGTVFGDGLRCAGGAIVRLGPKFNVGGASRYPVAGDQPISQRGSVTTPGVRTYQCWYRNSAPFCAPSTFNMTNGWAVTWTP